jgi:uncharacterized membrane protein
MLRKVIATGVTGLGISAGAMVPSAMPEENPLQLLNQQISRLTEAIQRQMATDEERFRRIEEDVRQLKQRPDNTTTVRPITVQPSSAQPSSAQPSSARPSSAQLSSAQPSSARPSSAQPSSAQPSSAQPPRHRHYYPRYVWCPLPWCEPWW